MLFVPPSMPFMVPEAEAAHEVPHPITDLSQPVPSGTVIEYDLNWNAFSPSGWHELIIIIDNEDTDSYGTTYLYQFDQDAYCTGKGHGLTVTTTWNPGSGYCHQAVLIKEGEWDYLLRIHTDGAPAGPPSADAIADGNYKIQVSLYTTPTSTITGYSTFTIGEVDTTPPVVTVPDNMTVSAPSSSGSSVTFSVAAVDAVEGVHYADCVPSGTTAGGYGVGSTDGWDWEDTLSLGNPTTFTVLFPVGTTTVFCNATDNTGNEGSASFTVNVVLEDTTPPTIWFNNFNCEYVSAESLCLDNTTITRTALNSTGYNFYWHPLASDDVSTYASGIDILCTVNNVTVPSFTTTWMGKFQHNHLFPIGTNQVICTAYDAAGNTSSASFVVIVLEPPALPGTEEEEIVIPSWIKSNAGWWDAGLIDDRNYVTGLQWLITNGIMTIPSTEQGTGSDDVIPSWVKNNARWWADGSIDDRNYVTGLQWLITNGVMTIG